MMRGLARAAGSSRASARLIGLLERLDPGRSHLLPVLCYHRVCDPSAEPRAHRGLCVPPAAFAEQLDALAARYEVVTLADVLDARRHEHRLPRRALLITFDDAYDDFASTAWPMLRERSLPAALFVPTGFPDTDQVFWWDRLAELIAADPDRATIPSPLGDLPVTTERDRRRTFAELRAACKRMSMPEVTAYLDTLAAEVGAPPASGRVLGWEALRQLGAEGVTIAAHSRSHPILTTLSDDELDDELRTSRADIAREMGTDVPCFAYPSGIHDDRVVHATEEAGYEVAFTTRRGINDLRRQSWLRMLRINIGSATPATFIRAQLGSWMALRGAR
jgi:peptidoglycan/xylan/chitin deacetylase (PgdA/CDA1 family)